jgi:hypothetical protein
MTMTTWAKIKFFWETMLGSEGSTLTASTTATGDYSAAYIFNMLETNMWKAANTTTPVYLTYDAGVGNTKSADYIAMAGHNLSSIGASVTLQHSPDNSAWTDAFTAFQPATDRAFLKEFTSPGAKRYWRLKLTGALSAAPYVATCIWGLKTELDYATGTFDPYAEDVQASVNVSQAGFVTGVHKKHSVRDMTLQFSDADPALYSLIKAWWDGSGLKNFFVAWETNNNPTDVWLMRPVEKFNNPLALGGARRNISISLKGRKE